MIIAKTTPTIELDTGIDLAGASELKILYRGPDLSRGEIEATADGQKVVAKLPLNVNTLHGDWEFQSYAKFGDDVFKGEIVEKTIGRSLKT